MKKLFALLAMLLLFAVPVQADIMTAAQLNAKGITVGVDQGSAAELTVRKLLPEATVAYFTDKFMGYIAVAQGKIDAFVYDRVQMQLAIENGQSGVHLLDEILGDTIQIAVGLSPVSKIPNLESQINRFIAELRMSGTLEDMYRRWVIEDNEIMPQINLPDHADLHLVVGTSGIVQPYSYYQDGVLNGYDIELAYRFAAWLGADVQFKVYDYGAIIPAAITGDVDCVMANLNITPERAEALTFSDVLYENAVGIMVQGENKAQNVPAWKDYNGKRIGVLTGPLMETIAHENFPDSEYLLFNGYPDCNMALLAGRIDAYLGDEAELKSTHAEQPKIDYIHERITNQEYSFAFRKDDPRSAALCEELNAFLSLCHQDGTLQELNDIWFGVDETRKVVDMSDLTGENGVIRVVTTSTDMPWSYIKEGKNVGYDIDLVVRFCRHAGYQLELGDVDFAARIPAIQSGKYDFSTDMNVTEERKEQVLFSDPTSAGGVVLAVRTAELYGADHNAVPSSVSSMNGKRAGVITGSFHDSVIEEELPASAISQFNNYMDMIAALKANKIDYFLASREVADLILEADDTVSVLADPIRVLDIGAMFAKTERGDMLRAQMDEYIERIRTDGTLDSIYQFWSDPANESTPVNMSGLTGENGMLQFATSGTKVPVSFVANGQIAGTDPDIAVRFCREYGYGIEIHIVDTAGIIPGIVTGMYDFALSDMVVTEERKESVSFSVPYHGTELMVMTRKDAADAATNVSDEKTGALSDLASSFSKTFLREDRWKLFLEGIGNTMVITLLSIFFGTALGFLVFMLCRNGNILANGVTRFCIWLVTGTPMVVLLMILYYIIFGSVAISGIAVAVIGFTLTFGAAVYGLLKMGVGTIDRGQYEAAYALGHSNLHTFFKIILPQAIPHVLPAYQGEIVGLIKATAIVGYIAVQDLTKMGDIVRSRTYEAFFPLIAVTIIYFVLEGLFSFLVSRIRISIDPKKRKRERILKGVNIHD